MSFQSFQTHPFVGAKRRRLRAGELRVIFDPLTPVELECIAKGCRPAEKVWSRADLQSLAGLSRSALSEMGVAEIMDQWRRASARLLLSAEQQPLPYLWTRHQLEWALLRLRDLAIGGDREALESYATLVWRSVRDLETLLVDHADLVCGWSRSVSEVPVLVGREAGSLGKLKTLLESFDVGGQVATGLGKARRGRARAYDSAANRIASELYARMSQYRHLGPNFQAEEDVSSVSRAIKKLPPFSKRTAKKWAELGWKWIMEITANEPEKLPALRGIGAIAGSKAHPGTGTEKSLIRHKIKERLQDSYIGLAPQCGLARKCTN